MTALVRTQFKWKRTAFYGVNPDITVFHAVVLVASFYIGIVIFDDERRIILAVFGTFIPIFGNNDLMGNMLSSKNVIACWNTFIIVGCHE